MSTSDSEYYEPIYFSKAEEIIQIRFELLNNELGPSDLPLRTVVNLLSDVQKLISKLEEGAVGDTESRDVKWSVDFERSGFRNDTNSEDEFQSPG